MAFSNFTLEKVAAELGIDMITNRPLFPKDITAISVSNFLKQALEYFAPLAVVSEKAKSEFIIAPVLAELRRYFQDKISLLSGIAFSVDRERGLEGVCDFIISLGLQHYYLTTPIFTVVEAKKDDIIGGLGQCIATMYAASLFNQKADEDLTCIYGVVTNGQLWRFIKLENQTAYIDTEDYFTKDIEQLMAVLNQIVKNVQKNKKPKINIKTV